MQSLNIITNVLPQDTDLKAKEYLGIRNDFDKKTSFSHLVNQHVDSEKRISDNKKQTNIDDFNLINSRKTLAASEQIEQLNHKGAEKAELSDQAIEDSSLNDTGETLLNINNIDTFNEAPVSIDKELKSSEQFMTLLYKSDKALTSAVTFSNLNVGEMDNDNLSEVDVAIANPLKNQLSLKSGVPILTADIPDNPGNVIKSGVHNLSNGDNQLGSANNMSDKLIEDSVGTKSTQLNEKLMPLEKMQLNSKHHINSDEAKPHASFNTANNLYTNTEKLTANGQFTKVSETDNTNEQLNSNKKVILVDLADQKTPMKLSIRQANQDFLKNSDLMTSNKVLPNKENHLENSHTGKSLNQPSDSEVVNDSLFLQHSNSKEDSKEGSKESSKEEVASLNRNNHPSVDTKSTTSKPQGLPKDLVLNNTIVSDSGLNNFLQPITEVTQQSQQANMITDKTINSSDILSKQVLKNIVEPKQFVENSDENLIEYFDETLSLDVDNVFSMNKTISDIKPINTFSDNANTRFSQDAQSQTNQILQSKQTNEAYLAHQVSETLNHNLASDTAHIQKNNVQLQQETIAIFRKDFADAVKDKVLVMINQKLQQFDITLDPPEFGNMQVRVNLQGEQASVNFVVQNQQAKEALEQNMQKLKDMLAEQGVDVGDANVDQKNQGEQNSQGDSFVSSELTNDNGVSEGEQVFSADLFNSSATAIDYYA